MDTASTVTLRENPVPTNVPQSEPATDRDQSRAQNWEGPPIGGVRALGRTSAFVAFSTAMLAKYELHRRLVAQSSRESLADRYRRTLVDAALTMFGAQVTVRGMLPSDGGVLVVANHQSALDIAVMLSVFSPVMVSRHDVADWPLLGRIARHGATIFVDRDDRLSGAAAVRSMRSRLREGRTVAAFPEGGTHGDDVIHEFHPGAFAAARSARAPILPVGIAYAPTVPYGRESFARHLIRIAEQPRTRISVHVGSALPTLRDARAAAVAARARVQALMTDARRDLDGS